MIHNKRNRFNPSRGEFFRKKNGYLNWIGPGVRHHPHIQHGYMAGEFKHEISVVQVSLNIQPLLRHIGLWWKNWLSQIFRHLCHLFDGLSRLCEFTATPGAQRSKHYVRSHPQLIKGVGALGSNMVTPIQVKDLTKGYTVRSVVQRWFEH
jgi:hypothetical protein